MDLTERQDAAQRIARDAGDLALDFFHRQGDLKIDRKGHQDFVSQADREVERHVRAALAKAFPDDAIVGEEHAPTPGASGFTWVIDPIDGTANFINAIPAWTVVLACTAKASTRIGVIHDPCHGETFHAVRGQGAFLNRTRLTLPTGLTLRDGTVGVGYSNRVGTDGYMRVTQAIFDEGGFILRNASGALSLAYAAAGRLLGYVEEHMNAWDCLAGQLLVEEAGGGVEKQDADLMIRTGGRVVTGAPGVFETLVALANQSFDARAE